MQDVGVVKILQQFEMKRDSSWHTLFLNVARHVLEGNRSGGTEFKEGAVAVEFGKVLALLDGPAFVNLKIFPMSFKGDGPECFLVTVVGEQH